MPRVPRVRVQRKAGAKKPSEQRRNVSSEGIKLLMGQRMKVAWLFAGPYIPQHRSYEM